MQEVKTQSTPKADTFWKIDKKMLPYKLHFFLYVGAMGAFIPFHPSIGITRLGLGAGKLTVVFTIQQFLFIAFKPLIGYITDYFNNLRTMIVILTILNGILSYLLLVIPSVGDVSASKQNGSYSELPLGGTNFCHLYCDLNQLQETMELLPKSDDLSQKGISCQKEHLIRQEFTCQCVCVKLISNSSVSFNVTNKITFETCPLLDREAAEKSGTNSESLSPHISEYTMYITVIHSRFLSQFSLECPKIKIPINVENFKLTTYFIMESCYLYPQENLSSNSTIIAKDIVCHDSALAKEGARPFQSNSLKTYQFWIFTLFLILSCTCSSAIFTLSDTACYESVQETGAEYGKQRAWGSVGWGLMAPFAGFLNDYTDSYLAAVILMTALCALQIWNLYKMDLVKPQNSQNILKDVRTVLSSAEFIAFSVGVLFNGMGIGIVWFFLAWFITDIGGSRLLIGLAHTMQCFLGEMPFMIFSGWLLKKIGHFNVVSMALLAHCVRFLAYSSLSNPWHILPIECLDGITFGAFYAAMTSYGKLNSKPGTEATTQSLLCSTYEGLGAGLGCVIAGVCFDYYGGYKTFFYAGLCFGVAAAINIASTVLLSFRKGSLEVSKDNICDNIRY